MVTVASLLGGLLAGGFASTVLNGFHATFAGMSFGPLDTIFTAIGLLMIGAGCYGMVFLTRAVKGYEMKANEEDFSWWRQQTQGGRRSMKARSHQSCIAVAMKSIPRER